MLDEVERAVVGKRDALRIVLLALLADGHVLIEDAPGLAKTLTARSFATVAGLGYGRVQFTPDLLPADITGVGDLRSARGRVRVPARTRVHAHAAGRRDQPRAAEDAGRAAGGDAGAPGDQRRQTRPLPRPFIVLATQNPLEFEGTYPLPEAQLDRFLVRIALGYPSADDEWEILRRRLERGAEEPELGAVIDRETLLAMQSAIEQVHVAEAIGRYIVELVGRHARARARTSSRRREPARRAGLLALGARRGRARRPRLRDPRGRQGGRDPSAGAPARAAARGVGAPRARRTTSSRSA